MKNALKVYLFTVFMGRFKMSAKEMAEMVNRYLQLQLKNMQQAQQ
jgi:hypothetical protein